VDRFSPGSLFPRRAGVGSSSRRAKSATAEKDLASGALCHRSTRERIVRCLRSPRSKFPNRPIFQWHPIFGHDDQRATKNDLGDEVPRIEACGLWVCHSLSSLAEPIPNSCNRSAEPVHRSSLLPRRLNFPVTFCHSSRCFVFASILATNPSGDTPNSPRRSRRHETDADEVLARHNLKSLAISG